MRVGYLVGAVALAVAAVPANAVVLFHDEGVIAAGEDYSNGYWLPVDTTLRLDFYYEDMQNSYHTIDRTAYYTFSQRYLDGTPFWGYNEIEIGSTNNQGIIDDHYSYDYGAFSSPEYGCTLPGGPGVCQDVGYYALQAFLLIDNESATPQHFSITFSTVDPVGVPEPATWALLIAGFGLIGGAMRRQPQSSSQRFAGYRSDPTAI